ncbi:hypothetical protein [Stappia sp.]|uniref:hypothetical protein n=1 Tax=Stappia sp. TaxID=1870903 RepID=UPI003C7AFE2E
MTALATGDVAAGFGFFQSMAVRKKILIAAMVNHWLTTSVGFSESQVDFTA